MNVLFFKSLLNEWMNECLTIYEWVRCMTDAGTTRDNFILPAPTRTEGKKEVFYLTMHSTHFIYGYMVKDHSDSKIEETCCCHMGYSFRLAAKVLLYAPFHRRDSTYNSRCYTSRGALAGTWNGSMGSPHEGSIPRPAWQLHHSNHLTKWKQYIGWYNV